MYAIQNKRTGKWLYGTDYTRSYKNQKYAQFTSFNKAQTFEDYGEATMQLRHRRCSRDYQIVEVQLVEVGNKT